MQSPEKMKMPAWHVTSLEEKNTKWEKVYRGWGAIIAKVTHTGNHCERLRGIKIKLHKLWTKKENQDYLVKSEHTQNEKQQNKIKIKGILAGATYHIVNNIIIIIIIFLN